MKELRFVLGGLTYWGGVRAKSIRILVEVRVRWIDESTR